MIKTSVTIQNAKTIFHFDINNVCGLHFYIKEIDLDISIYLSEGEELEIQIPYPNKDIKFCGERQILHALFFERFQNYQYKKISDFATCKNSFLKKEFIMCLEKWISEELLALKTIFVYDYYVDHFALSFLTKLKIEVGTKALTPKFINSYLLQNIIAPSNISGNLNNYEYYYCFSFYMSPPLDIFTSSDLQAYNFFLNIKDTRVLSFMLQIQLLILQEMNFPFNDFCQTYHESLKLSDLNFVFPQFLNQKTFCGQ